MTSFQYKVFQFILRASRYRNNMIKDLKRGNQRNTVPKGKLARRFIRTEFDGRAVWTIHPESGPTRQVYLHLHGGGYVYGFQPIMWRAYAELCDAAQMTMILPDYPLTPPATAADIHRWAAAQYASAAAEYGAENIQLGGDSAGANLALALAQIHAAQGTPMTRPLILWSPWLDLSPRETPITPEDDYEALITPYGLEPITEVLKGDMVRDNPLLSPAFADMADLPPVHIITGEQDILFPEISIFAAKAKRVGKLASLISEPEYGHYWMFYPVPDRHKTLRQIADILTG